MIIGMQASRNFADYSVFMRAMGTALYSLGEDTEFTILTAGPHKLNDMAMEFVNISERSLKAKGIKAKVVKMPDKAIQERLLDLDSFLYFSLPKETPSELALQAEAKDLEVLFYRF
jgi:hypothetical protein